MKSEILEVKKTCDYLLDELDFVLGMLRCRRSGRIVSVFMLTYVGSFLKKRKKEDLNLHIENIKFGLRKLRFELFDLQNPTFFIPEELMDCDLDIWFDKDVTELVFENNKKVLYNKFQEIKDKVQSLYDDVNESVWK